MIEIIDLILNQFLRILVGVILIGLIIQSGFTQTSLKLLMIGFFLLLTSPTATHAIAHSAYTANLKPKLGKHSFSKTRGGRS